MDSNPELQWEQAPEWGEVVRLIGEAQAAFRHRHPGLITEAIVTALTERFTFAPRPGPFLERRRNHPERIRRLSHAVYRAVDVRQAEVAAADIATQVFKAFIITAREGGTRPDEP